MKKGSINPLSAISLLLCAILIAMWSLSYFRMDTVKLARQHDYWIFKNMRGQLRFARAVPGDFSLYVRSNPTPGWTHEVTASTKLERVPGSNIYIWWGGFGLVTGPRWGDDHYELLIPHWFALLFFASIAGICLRQRSRMKLRGRCRMCGYDMRATPDRGPECGTLVPRASSP